MRKKSEEEAADPDTKNSRCQRERCEQARPSTSDATEEEGVKAMYPCTSIFMLGTSDAKCNAYHIKSAEHATTWSEWSTIATSKSKSYLEWMIYRKYHGTSITWRSTEHLKPLLFFCLF
jgi:hypothetical protein